MNLIFLELKILTRSRAFSLSLLLLGGLLCYAAYHQRTQLAERQAHVDEAERAFLLKRAETLESLRAVELGEKSFASMWDDPRGYYPWHERPAGFPASGFQFLAVGQSDLYAPLNKVGIFARANLAGRDIANPVPRLLGTFDPSFVLVFLLPLFIIGFAHGILAREREAGTLPLLMVRAESLVGLLALKAAPRFFLLTGAALVFSLIACAIAGVDFAANAGKVLWLLGFVFVYCLFWFLLALTVDLFIRATAMNVLALIGCWALIAILLPAGISTLSKKLFPMPSRIQLINKVREAGKKAEREASELMAQYYHDHPDLSLSGTIDEAHQGFFDYYRKSLSVGMAVDEMVAPTQGHFNHQRKAQQGFESVLSHLSPAASLAGSLEALAGTSAHYYNAYGAALARFSGEWRGYFQQKAFAGELIASSDPERFPAFTFEPEKAERHYPNRFWVLLGINGLLLAVIAVRTRPRFGYRLV